MCFFKQKTADDMRMSDWSSDVCSSDLTERWPDFAAFAAADDAEIMAAWAGLGYYARARNLIACARAIVADHGGRLPDTEAELRALPGIGDYTAAAIRSEERRVGKECVRTCRSRWSAYC